MQNVANKYKNYNIYILGNDSNKIIRIYIFRDDWWLVQGLPIFITGLFVRKLFGRTEYQHWIMKVIKILTAE